jgi:hypothetical protein
MLGGRADIGPGRADRYAADAGIRGGSEGEADEAVGTGDSIVRTTAPAPGSIREVETFLPS